MPKVPMLSAEEARPLQQQGVFSVDLSRRLRAFLRHPDASVYRLEDGSVLFELMRGLFTIYPSEEALVALLDRDPGKDWVRPWGTRVGAEGDQNVAVYLVQAAPGAITEALRPLAAGVEANAMGREVPVVGNHTFVFRWDGHPWTTVLRHSLAPQTDRRVREALLALGERPPVIEYDASDTTGGVEYVLYEGGRQVERLSAGTGDPEFQSRARVVTPAELEDPHETVADFFISQEAYVSMISPGYFFGERPPRTPTARVQNPGFTLALEKPVVSVPTFETVDYLWFAERLPRSPFG